jgi:hypothetical protein
MAAFVVSTSLAGRRGGRGHRRADFQVKPNARGMEAEWPSRHPLSRARLGFAGLFRFAAAGRFCMLSPPGIAKAAPQCVHKVDDVGLLNLVRSHGDRHALALTFDDLAQRRS